MSDEKTVLYDAKDGNIVCYLEQRQNGTNDLYEEYNKGVGRIVDSFVECVPKFDALKTCRDHENKELHQNVLDRIQALDELDTQVEKYEAMLLKCDEEQKCFQEEAVRSSEEASQAVIKTAAERQTEIQSVMQRLHSQSQNDIQKIESEYIQEAQTVKRNLLEKRETCNSAIAQLEKLMSYLERQKEVVVTDEEIQIQLEKYSRSPEEKNEAWSEYYESRRQSGALEKENSQRQEIEQIIQNRKNEIEKRVFIRLEDEKIGRDVIDGAGRVIRDEKEIIHLSDICARNAVFGGKRKCKKDFQDIIRKMGMMLFCYPRLFLLNWPDSENDQKTILPVSILLIWNYLLIEDYELPFWALAPVVGWLLIVILYCSIWRKKGKFAALDNIARIGIFKNIIIALYPIYLAFWEQCLSIFLIWIVISFSLCCMPNVLYAFKMKSPQNRKKYKEVFESTKDSYREKIQLTDKALKLYTIFYAEEEEKLQRYIEEKQRDTQQLSDCNQKEKKLIENEFETKGWRECITDKEKGLLQAREQVVKNNNRLDEEIACKKAEVYDKQDKISQIDRNIQELEKEAQLVISKQKQEQQVLYEQKLHNCQDELNSIKIETEKQINGIEKELRDKIDQKTKEIAIEKQKLQKELDTLNTVQKRQIIGKYEKAEQEIKERYQKEYQILYKSYRQHMDTNLQKLKSDGFAEDCGFNYVKAWSRLYPLISNTIGFPSSLNTFCKEILVGLTAKVTNANYEYCEIMPKNIPWGCENASAVLPLEMREEITDVLRGLPEFKEVQGWESHSIQNYHIACAPVDDLYTLRLTPIEDGPAMIAFDLGNLEQDIVVREKLRNFILRSFIFDFYHCLGSDLHLEGHIVSMNHAVDYTTFNNPLEESLKLQVYENKADIRLALKKMRENREMVRKKLKGADDLTQKNLKLSRYGQLPEDSYEVMLIINTDYKELDDSDLIYLVELSRDKGIGMYSLLFVDVNEIHNKEQSEKARSIEMLRKLADAVGYDERFYILERTEGTGFCLNRTDKESFVGRVME